jgi:hypothetical protein
MDVSQGAQRRLAAERADALQRGHEGLLDGFLGLLAIAQLGEGVAQQVRPVALDLGEARVGGGGGRRHFRGEILHRGGAALRLKRGA